MKNRWAAILENQSSIATTMVEGVPAALADPNLTFEQASDLYRSVEYGAKSFDAIVERMQHEDLDDSLYEAAESLEDVWSRLCVAAANKLRDMSGLSPIDIEDDDDEVDGEEVIPVVLNARAQ